MGPFVEILNDCGEIFIRSTGFVLIQSSVLIAILFGLDLLFRRHLRAVLRYSLWMLVLIKLVLPSNLSMPFSMGYWLTNAYDSVVNSLPIHTHPSNIPYQVASELSSESPDTVFDKPSQRGLVTAQDTGSSVIPNALPSTYSTKDQATDGHGKDNGVQAAEPMAALPSQEAGWTHDGTVTLTWRGLLFSLWLVVCTTTGSLILQKTLLIQKLLRQAPPADKYLVELFESCCQRIRMGRNVELRVSPFIPTPAVYGLFRPTVLIPERMLSHDLARNELETIFIHELVHIQRGDLWVKLLQTILQVVYFYNPLLWLANATIRKLRELAVDEAVLVILGESTGEVYPRTLIKVAAWVLDQPMHGLRLIGVMESNSLLTERIKVMLHKPAPHSKTIGTIGLITLFMLGVFLLPMARAGNQKVPTVTPEDLAEIQMMKVEIETLQKRIEMKLDSLHRKEAELGLRPQMPNERPFRFDLSTDAQEQPAKNRGMGGGMMMGGGIPDPHTTQPINRQPAGVGGMMMGGGFDSPSALPVQEQPAKNGGMGGGMMMGGGIPDPHTTQPINRQPAGVGGMMMGSPGVGIEQNGPMPQAAPQNNLSDEVRKELQAILPELLKEILPTLLKDAQKQRGGIPDAPAD